jgi:hypothetical protein
MEHYSFTVEIAGPITKLPDPEGAIFNAGCDDSLVAIVDGRVLVDFDRFSSSYDSAVSSAVHALENAGARIVSVKPISD